ncbi:MAG: sugar ABC transporter ATP-binding protein, partial [Rhizobiales bacterium]|nr:sugar ABC transporter ATP-binding protein [Hyphomicrobiales bacterium]
MASDILLEATGIAKHYGAVVALRNASLSVRRGEVHALMGANGAGTNGGRILIDGREHVVRSPAEARRAGLVSVYQEPALIPDLDIASNLRLTATPVEPFMKWVREMGVPDLDLRETARNLPLAILRVLDLARAIAVGPEVLLLDEMTAALPADLAEKVLAVVKRQGAEGRSVIFISHRMLEISALCDRATVLRDGETVGVVDIGPGSADRIVELMLGQKVERIQRE